MRAALDSWLGQPKWKAGHGRFTLYYRFDTTFLPVVRAKVKVEINTREHFAVEGVTSRELNVVNPWFSGSVEIPTYSLSELLGTKLRALYQRKKGRDLFDIALGLDRPDADPGALVAAFTQYMAFDQLTITRAMFEANMADKVTDTAFLDDLPSLLRTGLEYDPNEAWSRVHDTLVVRLPGEPWRSKENSVR